MTKQKLQNLPPNIQKLLEKKGWTWPPDEKLRKQIREAMDNMCGSLHTPPDILKQVMKEYGRFPDCELTKAKNRASISKEK